jgi:hypothetical protein
VLALTLAATVGLAATQNAEAVGGTFLRIESDPGDFIGQGSTFVREGAPWSFNVVGSTTTALSLTVTGPGEMWSFEFRSNEGPFVSGHTYYDAQRVPFHTGHNGMTVTAGSRGCNVSSGEFTVREIAFNGNALTKLDLVFVQHCEDDADATRGELAYNATIGNSGVLPRLWLSVTARPTVGGNLTYNANLFNMGPAESGLTTFSLPIPAGSTFVGIDSSQGSCNSVGTCQLGTIGGKDFLFVTVVVHPTTSGMLGATASFESQSSSGTSSYGVNFFTPVTVPQPNVTPALSFTSLRDVNPVLYSIAGDGSNERILAPSANSTFEPVWSPDGSRVLFDRIVDGNDDIYVANADGSGLTRLTTHPAVDEYPAWSPDGSKIVFDSDRNSPGTQHIFVMNANGTGVAQLTFGSGYDDTASFSPDGTKIAFDSDRTGNWEIFVMNANGSGVTNLTNNPADDTSRPAWSPAGDKIAFASDRAGNADVWVMNANGSSPVNLTASSPGSDSNPAWSPDGTKIAFDSDPTGANNDIYTMNANGSGRTRITTDPAYDFGPYWWPEPYASAPAILSAAPGDGQVTVSFTPPADTGFGQILYYTVTASPGGVSASGTGSPIVVHGLQNGTNYSFTVTATNQAGAGATSGAFGPVTPVGAERAHPDPPAPPPPRAPAPVFAAPPGPRALPPGS